MNPLNLRFAMGWLALGALVVSLNLRVLAATNLVVAGDDLQTKINAAAPGDTLVVQSGIYGGVGNLTITKPISLVRSGVERAVILLPVAVSAPGVVTFSKMDFGMDLGFGGTNCTVRIYDAVGKNIASTNGALVIRRSTFDGMVLTGTKLEALRLTNTAEVRLIGNGIGKPKVPAVLVQSRCESYLKFEQAVSATLGYCFLVAVKANDSEITAVGTKVFNWKDGHRLSSSYGLATAMDLRNSKTSLHNCQLFWSAAGGWSDQNLSVVSSEAGGSLLIKNCDLILYGAGWPGRFPRDAVGVGVRTGKAEIQNSFFHLESLGTPDPVNSLIFLWDNPSVKIADCASVGYDWGSGFKFQGDWSGDAFGSVSINDSIVFPNGRWGVNISASIPTINCRWLPNAKNTITIPTTGPNAYKDFTNELAADSPLINAGSDDPVLRNRDGTRNTIGATGGPMYNPALATTDQPMAFWLGLFPQRIVKGLVNTVDLDAAAAAGH